MSKTTNLARLEVLPQPNETTCGPTCLHAVYRFYGDDLPLDEVIQEVVPLETGGTLAVYLACHALEKGYNATIFSLNLQVFDPSWFTPGVDLADKLRRQMAAKNDERLTLATQAYLKFLDLGGTLRHEELRNDLLLRYIDRGVPILTGLSATYLYGCRRERDDNQYDDILGQPTGHFVVLCGYDHDSTRVRVADPLYNNPKYGSHYYEVRSERLLGAIMLGIVTYDANLLVVERKG